MQITFSEAPGRHERHYRRRLANPLFGARQQAPDDNDLLDAQRLDHHELITFIGDLQATVQAAVELKPNEESDVILALKERLDRLYETSAGLAEDQHGNQLAIRQLLAVIMRSVWANAAGDALASQELEMEERARTLHFDLLREPLVADLLHPHSVVLGEDLAATLLSETHTAAAAAAQLFDGGQLAHLLADAQRLVSTCELDPQRHANAVARLELLQQALAASSGGTLN